MTASTTSRRGTTGARLLEPFAHALVSFDLPGLPAGRREAAVGFAFDRIAVMPGPMRLGVMCIAVVVRLAMRFAGADRVVGGIAETGLPLLGEYARLHRSLVYAYVWETWPDTRPDGSPT